jgi:SagB-type dehydrogenase family enzyme
MGALLRRATALVITLEGAALHAEAFLVRRRSPLSPMSVSLLLAFAAPRPAADAFVGVRDPAERAEVGAELLRLLDQGLLVAEGSPAAEEDAAYARAWRWGALAGYYHFGIKDTPYQPPAVVHAYLTQQAATDPAPPLYTPNPPGALHLPAPALTPAQLALLLGRRSTRAFAEAALPLQALADCLFAGLAIVGFGESGAPGEAALPLTPTPSGGARNPFEAYVVARAVEGLAPGVYHYAGVDQSLARVGSAGPPPPLEQLLGGQAWFAGAGAVVLLVARFERCMWKYPHATGFRVVLLEAGHIAQNLLLAATAHGLAAAPTCALSDRAVETLLGLDRVREAAVHAVALGVRGGPPSPADLAAVRPNPSLRLPR